jgi:hypothetical protein
MGSQRSTEQQQLLMGDPVKGRKHRRQHHLRNVISTCPITINNMQPGGTSLTDNIVKQITRPSTCN